ncbi:MAG: antitoxin [Candidatus Njordarchaeota archaeon]
MSVVIGVRISKELKQKLDELGIKVSDEIKKYLEDLVWRETMRKIMEDIHNIRKKIGRIKGNLSAEFVREDRDER